MQSRLSHSSCPHVHSKGKQVIISLLHTRAHVSHSPYPELTSPKVTLCRGPRMSNHKQVARLPLQPKTARPAYQLRRPRATIAGQPPYIPSLRSIDIAESQTREIRLGGAWLISIPRSQTAPGYRSPHADCNLSQRHLLISSAKQ